MLCPADGKLLIAGGHPRCKGGVEVFIDRSRECLENFSDFDIRHIYTCSSFLRLSTLHLYIYAFYRAATMRKDGFRSIWLQYVSFPDLLFIPFCRAIGCFVVVTPHLGASWASLRNPFLAGASKFLLAFANRVALLSESQQMELNLPARTAPVFIRTMLPRLGQGSSIEDRHSTLRLTHIARLSDGKGTFDFLRVCDRLNALGLDFHADIVGSCDAQYLSAINKFIAINELHDRVDVYQWMSQESILDVLSKTDVLIHLSKVDSYPLIVLEAISCGAFPICRSLPGASEIARKYCGAVISSEDVIQETVARLFSTPYTLWREIAKEGSRRLNFDYGWEVCGTLLRCALSDSSVDTMPEAALEHTA